MPNAPGGEQREPWMQFGGFYRPINDLSQPWVASPGVNTQALPPTKSALPIPVRPVAVDDGDRGKKRRRKAWRFFDRFRGVSSANLNLNLTRSRSNSKELTSHLLFA